MKTYILLGVLSLAPFTVCGQPIRKALQQKYPQAADGSFAVEPDVTVKAIYGDRQQACVLAILGVISAEELN